MSFRTPLGRVRGLGSAKDGTGHWWMQRLTALALVPITVWFVISVIGMAGASYAEFSAWLANPLVAGLFLILIAATFYHAVLGLQVVVEDYLHNEGVKIATLLAVKAAAVLLGLTAALSVLRLLFA